MQPMSLIFQVQDGTWSREVPAATESYSGTSHRSHVCISYIIIWQAEPVNSVQWINLAFKWQHRLSPVNSVTRKHTDTSIIESYYCSTCGLPEVAVTNCA